LLPLLKPTVPKIEMKKVIVLGGAGYFGSVLVKQLLKEGFYTVVVDDFSFGTNAADYHGNTNLEIIQSDIRNLSPNLFKDTYAVVNLVALSNDGVCDLYPQRALDINLTGALRAANQAKKSGVRRYLFASSCAIYGYGTQLSEDSTPSPKSHYAKLKLEAERLLSKLGNSHFSVTFLRNGTLYGLSPKMRFDLMVNTMILSAFRDGVIKINGTGNQWRPITHVQDAANIFIAALRAEKRNVSGESFNVVSENTQVQDVAKKINTLLPDTKIHFNSHEDNRSYSVENDKVKKILGFKKVMDLEESIQAVIDALEKNAVTDGPESKVIDTYKKKFESILL